MRNLLTRLLTGWRNITARWDAALDDTDDTPTGNGEPMVIDDTIITVYAPSHLPALGYVRVPSQQHRQRLDCSDCEATHE